MGTETAHSREYLEEALAMARKSLPGWAFAMICQQARAKAGARVAAERRQERRSEATSDDEPVVKADSFVAPQGVQDAAQRGLELRKEFGRGGTAVGIARARDLAGGRGVSLETVRRMKAFFDRHESNKDTPPEEGNGKIAWLLWGGDPGRRWAERILRENVAKAAADDARTDIQTLIFSKDNFGQSQAEAWALEHSYTAEKVDETPDSFRIRQRPPAAFEDESFRTIDITEGVQAVIGVPKEEQATATTKHIAEGTGGSHRHVLKRPLGRTDRDGEHVHAFLLPSGMVVLTDYDGAHEHSMESGASETGEDSSGHEHRVMLPDGTEMATSGEGKHAHEALIVTTADDGVHTHELALPSGEVITSMTPAEYFEHKRERILDGKEVSEMMQVAAAPMAGPEPAPVVEMQQELAAEVAQSPAVAFIGSHDSPLDRARREPLTGAAGAIFNARYLEPLGLKRSEVLVRNINGDIEATRKALKEAGPKVVIALGRDARDSLGKLADFMLPHPHVLTRRDDTGEVARKLRVVTKRLAVDSDGGYIPGVIVPIAKADDEKRIVYGVVLDPYTVDAHDEHVPARVIETTAHEWLSSSRLIGVEHTQLAKAVPVESHLVHYPTAQDRELAFSGRPHKAYQMRFGADVVHSGAWILGTKLGDAEWGAVKDGRINAYSIGGFSVKVPMTDEEMPQVEFIDLGG